MCKNKQQFLIFAEKREMDSNIQTDNSQQKKTEQRNRLTILCIMSLIAIVLTGLYDFMLMAMKSVPEDVMKEALEISKQQIEQLNVGNAEEANLGIMYKMIDNSPFHFLFNIIELVGVILLLKKNKTGLHFYIASQIGFSYVAYVAQPEMALLLIMLCALWSLMYWRDVKEME